MTLRVPEGAEVTDRGDAGTFVIVADPADVAVRVYRACGFADRETQFSFERPGWE